MEPAALYEIKKTFNQRGMLICFAGPFSHSIIEELGTAVKRYLEAEELTKASLMDVFSVFIEQTQNVRNYAEQKASQGNTDCDFNSGIVAIGKNGVKYVVSSGNFAERRDIQRAIEKLEELKALDKLGLKAAYKEQMRRELPPGQTSGLGLIDMSRKTSIPLEYSIIDVDNRYCFFSLTATL
jgi:hypothetical protein